MSEIRLARSMREVLDEAELPAPNLDPLFRLLDAIEQAVIQKRGTGPSPRYIVLSREIYLSLMTLVPLMRPDLAHEDVELFGLHVIVLPGLSTGFKVIGSAAQEAGSTEPV
jgi:hypothetical protein